MEIKLNAASISVVVLLALNLIGFAFAYGRMEARVDILEKDHAPDQTAHGPAPATLTALDNLRKDVQRIEKRHDELVGIVRPYLMIPPPQEMPDDRPGPN